MAIASIGTMVICSSVEEIRYKFSVSYFMTWFTFYIQYGILQILIPKSYGIHFCFTGNWSSKADVWALVPEVPGLTGSCHAPGRYPLSTNSTPDHKARESKARISQQPNWISTTLEPHPVDYPPSTFINTDSNVPFVVGWLLFFFFFAVTIKQGPKFCYLPWCIYSKLELI